MRMRRRPNLESRMKKCTDLVENNPEMLKGKWLSEEKTLEDLNLNSDAVKDDLQKKQLD
jgi:hypothetical protein